MGRRGQNWGRKCSDDLMIFLQRRREHCVERSEADPNGEDDTGKGAKMTMNSDEESLCWQLRSSMICDARKTKLGKPI